MRVEPCACGGTIRADDTFPALVEAAIRTHVQTRSHVAWRARIKRESPENPAHDLLVHALERSRAMHPDLLIPLRAHPRQSVLSKVAS